MQGDNGTYRIRTKVGDESESLHVKLEQSVDTFEILSLKLSQESMYKYHTSKNGLIIGRVLANGGFGIPNAKVSVFIKSRLSGALDNITYNLYPYKSTSAKNADGQRYNLLTDKQKDDCHRVVGSFPNKRYMLDNDTLLEIFDDYYKFTTTTNDAGDYMIPAVPTGSQTIHVDLDLSDIGILSQRPRDFIYKGYNINQFENANQFKQSTSLGSLVQVYSQDTTVNVVPFWGDEEENSTIGITRCDIDIQYTFTPTCVFMGCAVSDNGSNGVSKKCIPSDSMGKMNELVTGSGTIEMIRMNAKGKAESFQVQGNQLINGDGIWCYQIPMNLDYVVTDEYGKLVPTDDPNKGIATRARVRFRASLQDFDNNDSNNNRVKVLIPHNPKNKNELDYYFGTSTKDTSYRDLFWNNVYTVKSFIPRFQKTNSMKSERFSGIKQCNIYGQNNPIPYNNIRMRITLMFAIMCVIIKCYIWVIGIYNIMMELILLKVLYQFIGAVNGFIMSIGGWILKFFGVWDGFDREWLKNSRCNYVGEDLCPDLENWYFAPRCAGWSFDTYPHGNMFENTYDFINIGEGYVSAGDVDRVTIDQKSVDEQNTESLEKNIATNEEGKEIGYKLESNAAFCLTRNTDYLIECIEINLAQEYQVIKFDFYNDWINGMIYVPRWIRQIKKKRTLLFGLFKIPARVKACNENFSQSRKLVQQCTLSYEVDLYDGGKMAIQNENGCHNKKQVCHKKQGRTRCSIFGSNKGIVHGEETTKGETVYYFKPCEWKGSKKVIFFATDIVLLGSLNSCDRNGIPEAFKYLSSSTYQMPTNLALTNFDEEGFMYSGVTDGDTRCGSSWDWGETGQDSTGINVPKTQTFTKYEEWSNWKSRNKETGQSGSEVIDSDSNKDVIAITEASGIDWGYVGPGQGEIKGGTENEQGKVNDLDSLYFPGGHFLGVSCFNTQSNIKSCVNLERVCELGAGFSQRMEFPRKLSGSSSNPYFDYENGYLTVTPNGLISKDEIVDSDFRNMFATMNINNLTTKINDETGFPTYDFKFCRPMNFNGALTDKIGSGSQYYATGVDYNERTGKRDNYSIRRTLENSNEDYLRFRFGITKENLYDAETELRNRFLVTNGSSWSVPMRENSFYFYFGLHDGATALDAFKKDYYATCPGMQEYNGYVEVKVTDIPACESSKEKGKASMVIYDATYSSHKLYKDGVEYTAAKFDDNKGLIENLEEGTYDLEVTTVAGAVLSTKFEIIKLTYDYNVSTSDFSAYSEDPASLGDKRGYIMFDGTVTNGEVKTIEVLKSDSYSGATVVVEKISDPAKIKALYSNPKIYVNYPDKYYLLQITLEGCSSKITTERFFIAGIREVDIAFNAGKPYQLFYNKYLKNIGNSDNWWVNKRSSITNKVAMWLIEKNLFLTEKKSKKATTNLNVSAKYGTKKYSIVKMGQGALTENGVYKLDSAGRKEDTTEDDYNRSMQAVTCPVGGYYVNSSLKERMSFTMNVKDTGDTSNPTCPQSGDFYIPAYYRPFWYNVTLWVPCNSFNYISRIAGISLKDYHNGYIYNGITYNGVYGTGTTLNGSRLNLTPSKAGDDWTMSAKNTENDTNGRAYNLLKNGPHDTNFSVPSSSTGYTLVVQEGHPSKSEFANEGIDMTQMAPYIASISGTVSCQFFSNVTYRVDVNEESGQKTLYYQGSGDSNGVSYYYIRGQRVGSSSSVKCPFVVQDIGEGNVRYYQNKDSVLFTKKINISILSRGNDYVDKKDVIPINVDSAQENSMSVNWSGYIIGVASYNNDKDNNLCIIKFFHIVARNDEQWD